MNPLTPFARTWNRAVDGLSFNRELTQTLDALNAELERPGLPPWPPSHPSGFIREFRRRRLSIAEAYLTIVKHLDSEQVGARLESLSLLRDQAFHGKGVKMPLNTARVQVALMKRFVKHLGDRRSQLECLRDFTLTSFAQPTVIRRALDRLHLIEVPETGAPLSELGLGFDDHVHDNASYGRKTASQLVLDAFLKGLSRITVVHTSLGQPAILEEALEAGHILGVHVRLAVEFSVGPLGRRQHLHYRFPRLPRAQDLESFFSRHASVIRPLQEALAENQNRRLRTMQGLLDRFNTAHLPVLNEGWGDVPGGTLPPLSLDQLKEIVPLTHGTRVHLGVLLSACLEPILVRRRLILAGRVKAMAVSGEGGPVAREHLAKSLEQVTAELADLHPESVRRRYLHHPEIQEYPSAIPSIDFLDPLRDKTGGTLHLIHPLSRGFDEAAKFLLTEGHRLSGVEVFNMLDHGGRDPHMLVRFSKFVQVLNTGDVPAVSNFLKQGGVTVDGMNLPEACARLRSRGPLSAEIGSDSTGRVDQVPGMGFIHLDRVPPRQRERYLANHLQVPPDLLPPCHGPVVSMGKTLLKLLGAPSQADVRTPLRAWRYLNPFIKNTATIAAGFIAPLLVVGPFYAGLWFFITGLRNAVVDMSAARGVSPRFWNPKVINFDNLAVSLFFTGFSVPLLTAVKWGFDHTWAWPEHTVLTGTVKFLVICLVNGLYLFSHNLLRGFDLPTARLNIFRSLMAWPLATGFEPLLNLAHLPSVVQAKLWSDFVAGLIEGSGKSLAIGDLRRRNLVEVLGLLSHPDDRRRSGAWIDLLYFHRTDPRSRVVLGELLTGKPGRFERLRLRLTRENPPPSRPADSALIAAFTGDSRNLTELCTHAVTGYSHHEAAAIQDWIIPAFYDIRRERTGG